MNHRYYQLSILSVLLLTAIQGAGYTEITREPVFSSGEEGYHSFRIPALIVSPGGRLLAFCEGRKHGVGDTGDIALVMKASEDMGKTWGAPRVVWDDPGNTCGNPCPVVDRQTNTLWLLMTWNLGEDREPAIIRGESRDTRRIYVTSSSDDGEGWSRPREITSQVKKADWTWYATGPGNGIQLETGAHRGRLVIPCDHIEARTEAYYSHVIYSDDHGESWQLGGRTPRDEVNECCVVELDDGSLLLNMRNYNPEKRTRQIAFSRDGGMHWEDQCFDGTLIEPICQASMIRYRGAKGTTPCLLFSNPADEKKRVAMTVRCSRDEGKSWPHALLLHEGPSAYSSLAELPGGDGACLFEAGEKGPYEYIYFSRIPAGKLQKEQP